MNDLKQQEDCSPGELQSLGGAIRPGTLFAGRYEVQRCIGTGGMGSVYLVHDLRYRNFEVALKVLHPGIIRTPEHRERFRMEIIASYRANHRNIVRAYEYFDQQTVQAYAMEYVRGEDLQIRMERQRFSVDESVKILLQAARGLGAIHEVGILHRDLKPENILVTDNLFVKIADFGVARLRGQATSITQVGAMVGTPKYFSPEYIETGESDSRGDVYALGVIGYELLAGRSPFRAASRVSLMVERIKAPVPPISLVNPECPPELAAIIQKAMSVSVAHRYQSADDLSEDLELWLNERPLKHANAYDLLIHQESERVLREEGVEEGEEEKEGAECQIIEPERDEERSKPLPAKVVKAQKTTRRFDQYVVLMCSLAMAMTLISALILTRGAPSASSQALTEGYYTGVVLDEFSGKPLSIAFDVSSEGTDVFLGGERCYGRDDSTFECLGLRFKVAIRVAEPLGAVGVLLRDNGKELRWSVALKEEGAGSQM